MTSSRRPSECSTEVSCSISAQLGFGEFSSPKHVSPIRGAGSRNASPTGRVGSRNTSPSRQKVVKTKPRGLDKETAATFCKPIHPDVQMEDNNIWAMLPEDLLNEILARVPASILFRLRSVCRRWNYILQDSSFLKFHSQVSSHGPCLPTFWKNPQMPQCSAKFPRSLLDGYLVGGTQKRLFLVGRIGLYSTLQSMRIWELDHAKVKWVEISRMPPRYFRGLLRLSAGRFECFGQDNLICFTSGNQGKGLLYDVEKKIWSWIAGCALQSCSSSQLCLYEPRVDACVN